jgi:EAL domain-containing protein (putative c-di-GMP-specific phosphodiesterase class I)
VRGREALERALRASIDTGTIGPMFLPIMRLRTQEVVGFEIVPQWIGSHGLAVPHDRFIPIAEEAGLIHALSETVLRKACEAACQWPSPFAYRLTSIQVS